MLLQNLVTPKFFPYMRLLFLLRGVTPKLLLYHKSWSNNSVTLLRNQKFDEIGSRARYYKTIVSFSIYSMLK